MSSPTTFATPRTDRSIRATRKLQQNEGTKHQEAQRSCDDHATAKSATRLLAAIPQSNRPAMPALTHSRIQQRLVQTDTRQRPVSSVHTIRYPLVPFVTCTLVLAPFVTCKHRSGILHSNRNQTNQQPTNQPTNQPQPSPVRADNTPTLPVPVDDH